MHTRTQFHCTIDTIVLRSANQNELDSGTGTGSAPAISFTALKAPEL